jgi:hypothetical protein
VVREFDRRLGPTARFTAALVGPRQDCEHSYLAMVRQRLSGHRFMANLFRLHLHATALNLLIHLRRTLPAPDADEPRRPAPLPDADSPRAPTGAELRRAPPATWRLRLIKVAAEVIVSARRVLIRLSSAWPNLPTWRLVLQRVQRC